MVNGIPFYYFNLIVIGSILKSDRKQKELIYTVQMTYKLTKIFPREIHTKGVIYTVHNITVYLLLLCTHI